MGRRWGVLMKGSLIMFPKVSSQDGHLSQEVDRAA